MAANNHASEGDLPQSVPEVGERALEACFAAVMPRGVRIITPLPVRVPLKDCGALPGRVKEFISAYEPRVLSDGLYDHQADLLRKMSRNDGGGFVLTSSTGSGKSLCFWSWTVARLLADPNPAASAILCFPTQALMWSQAERIAQISVPESLVYYDSNRTTPFGGAIRLGSREIPWSIWKGSGWGAVVDDRMKQHERSEAFRRARVLISTLDKAHFDLVRGSKNFAGKEFVRNLAAVVIDEAHVYQGLFGANVHWFLRRLFLACDLLGILPPPVFLASATLPNAQDFAAKLTGLDPRRFTSVRDKTEPRIDVIDILEVRQALEEAARTPGLARVIMLLRPNGQCDAVSGVLADERTVGVITNAIYFARSKHDSRQVRLQIAPRADRRAHWVYDADLPPHERRVIEKRFNSGDIEGATILATCALELGVDIDGLDLCVMDELPPRKSSLLQRIGRVGRRGGKPGLAILSLTLNPFYGQVIDDAASSFSFGSVQMLPLPLHLEMVKWRHMLAAVAEWPSIARTQQGVSDQAFDNAMQKHFGQKCDWEGLRQRFDEKYGAVVDTTEMLWTHKGFRSVSTDAKVPLVAAEPRSGGFVEKIVDGERCDVAWIEDTQVFRDAHPEAVYLSHHGHRWRVCGYDHGFLLGAGRRTVLPSKILVQQIAEHVYTRGLWQEGYALATSLTLPSGASRPRTGTLSYGIWNYEKRWDGYLEYALPKRLLRRVTVAEVTQRFWQARESGERFPFLRPLQYRTFGWKWELGSAIHGVGPRDDNIPFANLLARFLAGAVEAAEADLSVTVDGPSGEIHVLDATRGGNGLSEALLWGERFGLGVSAAIRVLQEELPSPPSDDGPDGLQFLLGSEIDTRQAIETLSHLRTAWV